MTVTELQHRISSAEFAEWMAFYSLEPWGDEYEALERGVIAATIANTARDSKKRKQPYEPREFMVRFRKQAPKQSGSLLDKVKMINRMMGGKDYTDGDS